MKPTDDELEAMAKSLAFVANRTGMTVEKCEEITDKAAAMLRACKGRDRQVREQALREAAEIAKSAYLRRSAGGTVGGVIEQTRHNVSQTILALIKKGQTDE